MEYYMERCGDFLCYVQCVHTLIPEKCFLFRNIHARVPIHIIIQVINYVNTWSFNINLWKLNSCFFPGNNSIFSGDIYNHFEHFVLVILWNKLHDCLKLFHLQIYNTQCITNILLKLQDVTYFTPVWCDIFYNWWNTCIWCNTVHMAHNTPVHMYNYIVHMYICIQLTYLYTVHMYIVHMYLYTVHVFIQYTVHMYLYTVHVYLYTVHVYVYSLHVFVYSSCVFI